MAPNVALPTATPTLGPTRLLDFLHVPRLEDKISPNANDPRKETASGMVFLGICLCITFALAAPMIGIWLADRIKRRKLDPFKKLRDLERKGRRPGIDPPPYKKTPPKDSIWARQERYKTKKPPRAITSDQVLGIDKTSYLQRIVPQSEGSSQLLTVAPAHIGWARQKVTSAEDEEQYISPWDAEHTPNPVIFPWLQRKQLSEDNINGKNCERLQVMTMSSTSSPLIAVSPVEGSKHAPIENPFLDSPTEYTSSPPDSEKFYEPSEMVSRKHTASDQLDDAAQPSDHSSCLYRCDTCQTSYHSQGQLNVHLNRKHRRRYRCKHCDSAFALKADLKRHERGVHKDMYAVKAFYCANPTCAIPEKKFTRRDNFERHVRRCRSRGTG
ncbi:uncharacterized protein ALTATR162_LOCUS8642 [Alternaria atra]|uniref:C2H2-type domain-containing protein n=1 Tax=Alternaria atra TaxID=119953 RepID=A0A8J2N2V2_9PLEO|nr:uncharacterized protein ALTATR162_LOCUS8642 [Alternaria atra]CAG5178322.1 unnamed protein product [Alternaria atra]